jgi:protein TonB
MTGSSAKGQAKSVTVGKSSGFPALDEAALEAVRHWEFEPAKLNDMPIDSEDVEVPLLFKVSR